MGREAPWGFGCLKEDAVCQFTFNTNTNKWNDTQMLWDEIFCCYLFAMQFRAFFSPGVNECTKNTQMTADEAWPQSAATRTRRNVIKGSIDMEAIWNYLFEINSSNVRWISWQITAASSAILRRFVCSYLPSLPSFTRHPQIKGLALTALQKYSYPQERIYICSCSLWILCARLEGK